MASSLWAISVETAKQGDDPFCSAEQKGSSLRSSEFTVDEYNDVLYSTSKHLNVRGSWTVKFPRLGYLKKGQQVEVTGIVRRNGRDFGWYRINYNGQDAYVSAKYLSAKKPSGSKNSQNSSGSSYALDTPPGMDTQDPYADADAGYAIDTPAGMDTQDPLAD